MKHKKAMAASMLSMLILSLVFTGIGVTLVKKIDDGTSKHYDKQLCKQSVIMNSNWRIPISKIERHDLDCPTRYVTFNKKNVVIESRNFKDTQKIKCGNLGNRKDQECYLKEANRIISKLLFDCWDQFAAGRIEVLDAWDEKRQCVLCSRFEFSEEVQEAFKDTIGDLKVQHSEFGQSSNSDNFPLDNYMHANKPKLHKISYHDYIMDPVDVFRTPFYDYNLVEPYAIVFKAINEEQGKILSEGIWESIKSTDFVLNPFYEKKKDYQEEEPEFINIMDLIKYDEVAGQCDSLA